MNSFLRRIALALALGAAGPAAAQGADAKDNIAGPYVPTPWVIVDEMLKLKKVRLTTEDRDQILRYLTTANDLAH